MAEETPQVRVGLPRPVTPPASAGLRENGVHSTEPAAQPKRSRRGQPTKFLGLSPGRWGVVLAGTVIFAVVAVLAARWLVTTVPFQSFLRTYPGVYKLPPETPVGFPAWVQWQHFLSAFFIVLIVRSGLSVRNEKHPTAYFSLRRPRSGHGKISIALWLHQSVDVLWVVNGAVFVALLFLTGQWARIVPTSWAVFPNAVSALIQYVSLHWPADDGWANYNSLQQLSYFLVVFIAAPLAILTGVRMSTIWPARAKTLSRAYPIEWARAIHFPVMLFFVAFTFVHVVLVFATGALRNLNHMYAGSDVVSWTGFSIFAASLLIMVAAWFAVRPVVLAPIARLFGKVTSR